MPPHARTRIVSSPVLITTVPFGAVDPAPLDLLREHGIAFDMNPYGRRVQPDELRRLLPGRTVLIAGTESISNDAMATSPELRLIARASIGLDSVDLAAARRRGIQVTYTPDGPSTAVSEFTVGLMVSLLRGISGVDRLMHGGVWERRMGRRLARCTVGVLGAGRVGSRVIKHLLGGFPGVRVLAHDIAAPAMAADLGVEWVDMGTLLREADIVTVHVPLTVKTTRMAGSAELAAMKPGAFVINTSRGEIVDEAALAVALREGRLGGAAVDVFEHEPYAGELKSLDNCLLTCHMGSMSEDCRARMECEAAAEAVAFLEGRPPLIPVPEEEYVRAMEAEAFHLRTVR
jgi:D-3-phosphoglycerate dehydrogenase